MTLGTALDFNRHPTRESLKCGDPQSIHRQAYELAELIRDIPCDPNLQVKPRGIVVGSFALQPDLAQDIDIEVQGVTWENLQNYFADKVGMAGITSVALTRGGSDGIIDPTKEGQFGNAFVAVWLTLEGERSVNLSIPLKVNEHTNRYDLNSVERDPDLSFFEASKRRNFAHRAVGYDPLQGARGSAEDPHQGGARLKSKELEVLDPLTYQRDPIGLYQAIREMATYGMTPTAITRSLLERMSRLELPTGPAAMQENRLSYERALLLASKAPPSKCLMICFDLGVSERDLCDLAEVKRQLDRLGRGENWNHALQEVDSSWRTASEQTSWSFDDKVCLVAVQLGYEVKKICEDNGFSLSWQDVVDPFLPGEQSERVLLLDKISKGIERLHHAESEDANSAQQFPRAE